MQKVLTIAGSSSLGGAGIQADFKTFQECGVYGMGVITAFVTASPTQGRRIYPQPVQVVKAQCLTALSNMHIDTFKTGMLYSAEHIRYVAQLIGEHQPKHVIVDPVMVAKSGAELSQEEAVQAMKKTLFPLATIITPNVPEALKLSGLPHIESVDDMKSAAQNIYAYGPRYVLVKGGRLHHEQAIDVLYDGETFITFARERVKANTNGAGCTFSAAIAAKLAQGITVHEAVEEAKEYITEAIRGPIVFADGTQRINHAAYRKSGMGNLRS